MYKADEKDDILTMPKSQKGTRGKPEYLDIIKDAVISKMNLILASMAKKLTKRKEKTPIVYITERKNRIRR